jgi:3',5'-cyclic-AMP phosphodiesterase
LDGSVKDPNARRVALITDIHHATDQDGRSDGLCLLREFGKFVAEVCPALVLDLGDRITDQSQGRDALLMRELAEAFASLDAPVRHLCGNHDLVNLNGRG